MTDKNNAVRWTWLAEPFGSDAPETNPQGLDAFNLPLRFAGQYADTESGLLHNYHRDYDPWAGRYVQSDPIGLAGGLNTYEYANSDPLSYADPDGLNPKGLPRKAIDLLPLEGGGGGGGGCGSCGSATTSNFARRESMRNAGIPTSQQPVSQSQNASGREYSYSLPASGGGTQRMSTQQQTLDRSHRGQPHWETGPVKFDPLTGRVIYNAYGCSRLTNEKFKVEY